MYLRPGSLRFPLNLCFLTNASEPAEDYPVHGKLPANLSHGETPAFKLVIQLHQDLGAVLGLILDDFAPLNTLRHNTPAIIGVLFNAIVDFGTSIGKNYH